MTLDFDHMRAMTEWVCTCGGRGGDHPEACNACLMYHGFNAAEEEIRRLEDLIVRHREAATGDGESAVEACSALDDEGAAILGRRKAPDAS